MADEFAPGWPAEEVVTVTLDTPVSDWAEAELLLAAMRLGTDRGGAPCSAFMTPRAEAKEYVEWLDNRRD